MMGKYTIVNENQLNLKNYHNIYIKMDTESENFNGKINNIQSKLENVKGVMYQNIDNVLERGEKLEIMVEKTEELSSSAFQFNKNAKQLRRQMICKKIKIYFCISLSIIIFLWFLSSLICDFDYKKCS